MCIVHYAQYKECRHIEYSQVSKCGGALQGVRAATDSELVRNYRERHQHAGLDGSQEDQPAATSSNRFWRSLPSRTKAIRKESLVTQVQLLNQRKATISLPLTGLGEEEEDDYDDDDGGRCNGGLLNLGGKCGKRRRKKGSHDSTTLHPHAMGKTGVDIRSNVERFRNFWHFLGPRPRPTMAPNNLPYKGCLLSVTHVISPDSQGWCAACNWDSYQLFLRRASGIEDKSRTRPPPPALRSQSSLSTLGERSGREMRQGSLLRSPDLETQRLSLVPEQEVQETTPSPASASTEKRPQSPVERPMSPIDRLVAIPRKILNNKKRRKDSDIFGNPWSINTPSSPTCDDQRESRGVKEPQSPPSTRYEDRVASPRSSFVGVCISSPIVSHRPSSSFSRPHQPPSLGQEETQTSRKCEPKPPPPLRKRELLLGYAHVEGKAQERMTRASTAPPATLARTYTVLNPYSSTWPTAAVNKLAAPSPNRMMGMTLDSVLLGSSSTSDPSQESDAAHGDGKDNNEIRWSCLPPPPPPVHDKDDNNAGNGTCSPSSWRPGSPAGSNPNRVVAVFGSECGSERGSGSSSSHTKQSLVLASSSVAPHRTESSVRLSAMVAPLRTHRGADGKDDDTDNDNEIDGDLSHSQQPMASERGRRRSLVVSRRPSPIITRSRSAGDVEGGAVLAPPPPPLTRESRVPSWSSESVKSWSGNSVLYQLGGGSGVERRSGPVGGDDHHGWVPRNQDWDGEGEIDEIINVYLDDEEAAAAVSKQRKDDHRSLEVASWI